MWGQFCMFLFLETLNTCWHIQTVLEFGVKSEWFHQLYQLLNVRIVLKYLEQSRFEENLHPGWQINFLTSHSLQLLWSNELIALRFIGAYTVGWNHLLMHGAEYWSTHLATKRYWCVMLEVAAFSTCEMQMWPGQDLPWQACEMSSTNGHAMAQHFDLLRLLQRQFSFLLPLVSRF